MARRGGYQAANQVHVARRLKWQTWAETADTQAHKQKTGIEDEELVDATSGMLPPRT